MRFAIKTMMVGAVILLLATGYASADANAFIAAVEEGRLGEVKTLLQEGADPHATDELGVPAIFVAAWHDHIQIVRLLVSIGVEYELKRREPIHYTPFQLGMGEGVKPIQIVPPDWGVCGLRINFPFGVNREVYGIDIGLINRITHRGIGV